MKTSYNQFIGTYTDVYPVDYCKHLIDSFEYRSNNIAGAVLNRQQRGDKVRHHKDDASDFLDNFNVAQSNYPLFNELPCQEVFFFGLQKCFDEYVQQYTILQDFSLVASECKVQRTHPGGGYHLWHYERGKDEACKRVLAYMLYLNTLGPEEGGETEFLYQKLRIPPQENTLILWPADYTHTHRGNLVLGENYKYVVTGWFYDNS